MKKFVACAALMLALAPGVSAWAGTWSGSTTVASIDVESDASASNGTTTYVTFSGTPAGRPSCGASSQNVMTGSADHVRAMTSLMTAAFLAGRSTKVYWTGCSGAYPAFSMAQVF